MNKIKAQSAAYYANKHTQSARPIFDRTLCPFVAITFDTLNIGKVCYFLVVFMVKKLFFSCFRIKLQQKNKIEKIFSETKEKLNKREPAARYGIRRRVIKANYN